MEKCTYKEQHNSGLKDAWNNDKLNPLVCRAIELSAITHFKTLKRRRKDQSDQARSQNKTEQNRRDSRVRTVCVVLSVSHIIL